MQTRTTGLLLSLAGVTLISPDVLVMRWVDLDHASVLMWRGLFMTLGFSAVVLYRYRLAALRAIKRAGRLGVASGFCFALNTTCYTEAIQRTSATATVMIIATAPVFAALISWLVLDERIDRKTAISMFVTLIGIAIIATDGGGQNDMLGNLFAVCTAIFLAINFTLARLKSNIDLTPGLMFGGMIAATFGLMLGGAPQANTEWTQLGAIALTGAILMPIGFTLLQIAPRYTSATEVSLFLLFEAVLGPVWVWLVLNEAPTRTTLVGSVIIISALLYYGAPASWGTRLRLRLGMSSR